MKKIPFKTKVVIAILSLLPHSTIFGQTHGRNNNNKNNSNNVNKLNEKPKPVPVPIDSGAIILFAAGLAYALKRLNDFQKREVSI